MKAISGKRLAKILEQKSWVLQRTKSNHHIYVKEGSPARTSIPVHEDKPYKVRPAEAPHENRGDRRR